MLASEGASGPVRPLVPVRRGRCGSWLPERRHAGSEGNRDPVGQDRSGPFEDAETLDQLAPGTKQARPLDEAEQFERRSNPLTAPNRFLDQTLCLVQFARLEAERAERQDGVKEADVVFDPSCMCGFERSVRGDLAPVVADRGRRGRQT